MNAAAFEVRHTAERVLVCVVEKGRDTDLHEMTPDAADRLAGILTRAARRARLPHASLSDLIRGLP